jgi:hypothetical protein
MYIMTLMCCTCVDCKYVDRIQEIAVMVDVGFRIFTCDCMGTRVFQFPIGNERQYIESGYR